MSAARLIAGNLDCELEYAGSARGLPGAVAERASLVATLLRVFGEAGDRLWTPRPVDRSRVAGIPELPPVTYESGELAAAEPASEVLAWGETERVAALRLSRTSGPFERPLWRSLWRLPRPDPAAAARCNHRSFAFELARELGCALPGSRIVHSRRELESCLAAGGARAGRGAWVVKAPYGAAGRERVRRRGSVLPSDVVLRIDRLLDRYGELLFEPWVERSADYGICGAVLDGDAVTYPPHRLLCDRQGVIRAVTIDDDAPLPHDIEGELTSAAQRTARALGETGYRGPFNVDAFCYRDEAGASRLQPLCEINARLSLGFVARALGERVAAPRGASAASVSLRLQADAPPDAGTISLLHPSGPKSAGAWLLTDTSRD